MTVYRVSLVRLLRALGYAEAGTWDRRTLLNAIRRIPQTRRLPMDHPDAGFLINLLDAIKTRTPIRYLEGAGGGKKGFEKPKLPPPKPDPSRFPIPLSRGGVIDTLVGLLRRASRRSPLTKAAALAALTAAFPDRPRAALALTVNNQLPQRLRVVRGLKIGRSDRGYWINARPRYPKKKKPGRRGRPRQTRPG